MRFGAFFFLLGAVFGVAKEDLHQAIRTAGGTLRGPVAALSIGFEHGGRELDDRGLAHVGKLGPAVRALNLRDTRVTDAGMVEVAKLSQLRRLHLERTAIGDEGLASLAKLSQLEYLNLYGTKITDAGLLHLRGLPRLRQVYVWQTGVTAAGCRRLQAALPGVKIVRGVDLDQVVAAAITKKAEADKVERIVLDWVVADGQAIPRSKTGEFTTVDITNARSRTVKLYWSEYGGGLRFYHEIAAGETLRRNTYSRAIWVVTETDETPLGYFLCPEAPSKITIPK